MSNLTGDARAVSKKGGMLFAVSVIPREQPHFCLAAGRLSGFFTTNFTPSGFISLSLIFVTQHFYAGQTPWTSAGIFRAHGCKATKLVAWREVLHFLWVWDFLELGCFGILGHGKQENVVFSILTIMKWAACLKWGGFCKPQWHQLNTRKGCELGVGGEGGLLCASRQPKAGVQSTESCPKGRE